MLRRSVVILAIFLASCAPPRATMQFVPQGAKPGTVESIFVGTTREIDPTVESKLGFGRSSVMRYGKVDVSVPRDRALGTIPLPRPNRPLDPSTQFLTVDRTIYNDEAQFRRALGREMAHKKGDAVIFVHGFNNNAVESTYRMAQFGHDLKIPGALVHYAWPSRATALGYVYDRDSAIFASRGLEQLLKNVENAGPGKVVLVAHSMGSLITMEALARLALQGNRRVLDQIAGVILMSPDIDVDVFKGQAATIGKLPEPFIIFTSKKDKALAVSAKITGQTNRVGNLPDPTPLAGLKVTLIDTTAFSVGGGHFNVASSPALLAILSNISGVDDALASDGRGRTGVITGAMLTVQNTTQIIMSPVLPGSR
jgi:esterase/lipase superfamily enzyme